MSNSKPNYPKSKIIKNVEFDIHKRHFGTGDMWPLTWAADDKYYGGAGDNLGSPMNFWRIEGHPDNVVWEPNLFLVDNRPLDAKIYCQKPNVDPHMGIKPASLLSLKGTLYFAVQLMNFGDNPEFNRQHNISSWIITSQDYGETWNKEATAQEFFSKRIASPHFIQFGKDYEGARDNYIYAYFSAGEDGNSYWCNSDFLLLGRVEKDKILIRNSWEFYVGAQDGEPVWNCDDNKAQPVFKYYHMTGENHISYCKGLKRYIMGNYSFTDPEGNPRAYHQQNINPEIVSIFPSQLTLYEAPEPWGPWSIFYQDDNWGTCGDYQPCFPTKWMHDDGKVMWMVSSGSYNDYNFTLQKMMLTIEE